MIEKPKRPKKIPNQDNKQPQTIEQLIKRYDLDNTKIYDFLDELVGYLKKTQTVVSATEPTGDNREKVWIQKGKNLYNKNDVVNGYSVVVSTGKLTPYEGRTSSGYIAIEPNTNYIISKNGEGLASNCAIYDENKEYITGAQGFQISTPSNAKYIRFYNTTANMQIAQLEQGTTITTPKIYVKNDNYVYEELIKRETKNLITASLSENKTFTATVNYQNDIIPLKTEASIGNQLTITSDGGVKIGKNINHIKVSAVITTASTEGNAVYGASIYKNTTQQKAIFDRSTAGDFMAIPITDFFMNVSENDVIYLKSYIDVARDWIGIRQKYTYMTIEALD